MEYTNLGKTDIKISKLCVRCMSFGKAGTMHDWTLNETESETVVKHTLDLGINFFDTANGYSAGTSEEYLGRAIKNNIARDKVVIASKVYFNEGRLSKKNHSKRNRFKFTKTSNRLSGFEYYPSI